jgi:putative NADH-flavin reductase
MKVSVLSRSPLKAAGLTKNVNVIEGNLFDKTSLAVLVKEVDVVVSCAGPPMRGNYVPSDYVVAMRDLVDVMEENEVSRLITIAGGSIILPEERLFGKRKLLRFVFKLMFSKVVKTKDGELEIMAKSNLKWTALRPGFVKPKKEGNFVAHESKLLSTSVDKLQILTFIIECIKSDEWVGKSPLVATIK